MVVGVHEARQDRAAGAVDDLVLAGPLGADGGDGAVFNEDVPAHDLPLRVLGDQEAAPEQEGHAGAKRPPLDKAERRGHPQEGEDALASPWISR